MTINKYARIVLSLATGMMLLFGLFLVMRVPSVETDSRILYVSSTDPTCSAQSPCYATIQGAVDAAAAGDVIKVAAGTYTGVHSRAQITQVVYLSKSLTIKGGFRTDDWHTSNPKANPAIVDAQGLGRGLVISGSITPTIEGLTIRSGDATGLGGGTPLGRDAGGGVYVHAAAVTISECVIVENTASTAASGYGGGIYLTDSKPTLSGNTIISNTGSTVGSGRGGGVYLAYSNASLDGNSVHSNVAGSSTQGDGGGLYSWFSTSILQGNLVEDNIGSLSTGGSGGGLFFWGSDATLISNTVHDNAATLVGSSLQDSVAPGSSLIRSDRVRRQAMDAASCGEIVVVGQGGGLSFSGSTARLTSNMISGNTASNRVGGAGGGLSFSSSSGILSGNTIQGNIASSGSGNFSGGVGGGMDVYGNSTTTLIGNHILDNIASSTSIGYGGGLRFWRNTATLRHNRVQGNIASAAGCGIGGGVSIGRSDVTLNSNMVINNSANTNPDSSGWAGGLEISSSSPITLTNNVVAGNRAGSDGSGLWFAGESSYPTSGHLRHNTILGNNSGGEIGVYVGEYASLIFTNTIIADHGDVGITVTTGGKAFLEATLWHHNGLPIGGGGHIYTGTINIYQDPAFADPSVWDYHLTYKSPAIDEGVYAGVDHDIDGDLRPLDGDGDGNFVADIGADEFVLNRIFLPILIMGDSGAP